MRPEVPPPLPTRLLSRILPGRFREAILGDLAEEWRGRSGPAGSARLWYWREASALAVRYGWRRLALRRRWSTGLRGAAADASNALRHLVRSPRHSLAALALLGGGLSIASALFAILHATLLAPLPYPDPERLVRLHETHAESGVVEGPVAPGNLLDFAARSRSLVRLAAGYGTEAALTGGSPVESIRVGVVAGDPFEALGVEPLLGRTFRPDETRGARLDNAGRFRGAPRILLDERLWRTRFGAEHDLVGRTIAVNGQEVVVVGVLPATVPFPEPEVRAWVAWDPAAGNDTDDAPSRNARFLSAIGRLAEDVPIDEATSELAGIADTLALAHPQTNEGWSATLVPLSESLNAEARRPLLLIGGAIGLLLLGVCVNLAGMQAARHTSRASEMAIRAALGAPRARLFRQTLLENVLLALAAGLLGLLGGHFILGALGPSLAESLARPLRPGLDGVAVAGALLTALVAGLAIGISTAARAIGTEPAAGIRADSRGTAIGGHDGRWLVVVQVALAVALVATSGLLARSFAELWAEDPGFEPRSVLTARMNLEPGVLGSAASRAGFFEELLERLHAEPAVIGASGATFLPMSGVGPDFDRPYWRHGETPPGGNAPRAWIRIVTPELFRTLEIPLRSGRSFERSDRFRFEQPSPRDTAPRVVIVNRALAERSWPRGAVGETLVMDYPGAVYEYRIVGVVENVRAYGLASAPEPEIYLPYGQIPYPGLTLAIRTRGEPAAFGSRLRAIVERLNSLQPVDRVTPLSTLVASTLDRERIVLTAVGLFGLSAALLAAVGIFGLLDLRVRERRPELGIRLALGARPGELQRMVLRTTGTLTALGVLLGLGLTSLGARWLSASLYRTSPIDPVALGATILLIATAALAASWAPSRRASRVDPVETLRSD